MGTRADFYLGKGKEARWIGSVAWDGSPDSIPKSILEAKDEPTFASEVTTFLIRDDATLPSDGWPWPWDNSQTTDFAYAFIYSSSHKGKVWASCFGSKWFDPLEDRPEDEDDSKIEFPDMTNVQNVTFGPRSGIIILERSKDDGEK